jgi:hypothetical protein
MEKEVYSAINGIDKPDVYINTSGKTSRLQTFACSVPIETARNRTFTFELDENYATCTGISIVKAFNNNFTTLLNTISIKDQNRNLFSPVNVAFWDKTLTHIEKKDLFLPCHIRAKNNLSELNLNHGGVTTAFIFYVTFRIANNVPAPKYEYNFVEKSFAIAQNFIGVTNDNVNFENIYTKLVGIQSYTTGSSAEELIISLKYQNDVILNEMYYELIERSSNIPYVKSFFPINFNCSKKEIQIVSDYRAAASALHIKYYNFLVEKAFDKKYL